MSQKGSDMPCSFWTNMNRHNYSDTGRLQIRNYMLYCSFFETYRLGQI